MRFLPVIGTLLAAAIVTAGCSDGVERLDGAATPIGAVSASPSPAPSVTSPSSAPSSSPSPSPSESPSKSPSKSPPGSSPTSSSPKSRPTVLGPNGLGALKLGMSQKEAEATGVLTAFKGKINEGCNQPAHVRYASGINPGSDGMVYYSPGVLGIQIIDAYTGVRTPEGITLGSSAKAMRRAYPDWRNATEEDPTADGRGYAEVAGNGKARYRIVTANGLVVELTLQWVNQNCYE
ncbi:hypothetical protein [Actinoplanes friuliensis]|nr:hypothetical protein [Actinoplanes friuliensis]